MDKHLDNPDGFVLVGVILLLLILVFIGLTASTTTNIEMQIANNDMLYDTAFYNADGGTEAGSWLLEQNLSCPGGFASQIINGNIGMEAASLAFWKNSAIATPPPPAVSDALRDAYFPQNYQTNNTSSHTNLRFGGMAQATKGSGFQMIAGYEGKGKGAAGGGASIMYDVYSQGVEKNNAQSTVDIKWLHVVGQEGDCLY